jgi:hypothetical protein
MKIFSDLCRTLPSAPAFERGALSQKARLASDESDDARFDQVVIGHDYFVSLGPMQRPVSKAQEFTFCKHATACLALPLAPKKPISPLDTISLTVDVIRASLPDLSPTTIFGLTLL